MQPDIVSVQGTGIPTAQVRVKETLLMKVSDQRNLGPRRTQSGAPRGTLLKK